MQKEKKHDTPVLNEQSIANILTELDENGKIDRELPGGGFLHLSKILPYLVIHRLKQEKEDAETVRIVISEASYLIIGNEDFEGYQQLILKIGEKFSAKFKSFLLFEIYSGELHSRKFIVRGPAEILPSTIKVLKKELKSIQNKFYPLNLQTSVEDTKKRQAKGKYPLVSIDEVHQAGCLLLGLEIPWLHRNDEGEEFPIFFRNFKDLLVRAMHKAIFDFIRVQTSCGVSSYTALGRKYLSSISIGNSPKSNVPFNF